MKVATPIDAKTGDDRSDAVMLDARISMLLESGVKLQNQEKQHQGNQQSHHTDYQNFTQNEVFACLYANTALIIKQQNSIPYKLNSQQQTFQKKTNR